MEIQLLNRLYDLYLILLGAYIFLLIGVIVYMYEVHKLYKNQEMTREQIYKEIIKKLKS